jgi:DNA polymerase
MSTLNELYEEIKLCQQCGIARTRSRVVPGEGAENAEIMLIGEAPGWHEDQQGRPFVGPAGQYLDELLAIIALKRHQVYIANIIKCRPPDNRDPLPTEILNCRPWLEKQIDIISPKMIVTLGRYSLAHFFPGKSISRIHGTTQKRDGVIYYAMYHPAAALHQGSLRQAIEADMARIPSILEQYKDIPEAEPSDHQLKMFEV